MKRKQQSKAGRRRLLIICALIAVPVVTSLAMKAESTAAPLLDISVTNNSSREIHHLYISPADRNEWGPDLLDGRIVKTGESVSVNSVCPANEIKVIAEDKGGCFLYQPAMCTQSSTEWIITNQTPADCGTEQ